MARLAEGQRPQIQTFQSPSRGGHLRGLAHAASGASWERGFSPLHEGDTSVAVPRMIRSARFSRFQSPSRGGHLRGPPTGSVPYHSHLFQSPSRGGHLRGAAIKVSGVSNYEFQSPSRGGHLRGPGTPASAPYRRRCFSPLHEGDTSVAMRKANTTCFRSLFQSPSRGGHLRGGSINNTPI